MNRLTVLLVREEHTGILILLPSPDGVIHTFHDHFTFVMRDTADSFTDKFQEVKP
ncbi:MAG: hypothetical protein OXG88_06225 [Gammaproteobacteria bacterium]|nr:hypothetical protein [Gammaproteobacteria bacterium]